MSSRSPIAIDEWYHCYSRGIDRREAFSDARDYQRFVELLYLCNSDNKDIRIHRSDMGRRALSRVFETPRGSPLVAIGAFCLMPNHYHVLLKEIVESGISTFMQKVGTAYTMYFNKRRERIGNLFVGPFKSRHIHNDAYIQRVIDYIHCNPADLYEPKWKQGEVRDPARLEKKLLAYPYSSFNAFADRSHACRSIIDTEIFEIYRSVSPTRMIADSAAYYKEVFAVKARP